jgi:hypothetical protein
MRFTQEMAGWFQKYVFCVITVLGDLNQNKETIGVLILEI